MAPPDKLSFVVFSGDYGRIHYALVMASAAAAIDKAVTLSLAVNELVTNSVKHASWPEQGGTVTVELRREEGEQIVLNPLSSVKEAQDEALKTIDDLESKQQTDKSRSTNQNIAKSKKKGNKLLPLST